MVVELPPCKEKQSVPHVFEVMVRCKCCGFLIRMDGNSHPPRVVQWVWVAALRRMIEQAERRIRHCVVNTGGA